MPQTDYDKSVRNIFIFVISLLLILALHFSFQKIYADDLSCATFAPDGETCLEVDTAVGKISTEPQKFIQTIFKIVLGLAGGISLILIIVSGYKYMASQGNPEAIKAATEQLTSAIIGLLFIIFSFVILQIVGVDILQIPGFK